MKKYLFLLFALTSSVLGSYAMNLKEAYNALSNLPKISTQLDDAVSVSVNDVVEVKNGILKVAGARNLNSEDIKTVGNATFAILNQVPLSDMINGGNNGDVAAFVYCVPNESGSNDMLIVTMSGEQGDLTYLYMTDVDDATKLSIQEGRLTIHENSLSIVPSNSTGAIGAIKVNCR